MYRTRLVTPLCWTQLLAPRMGMVVIANLAISGCDYLHQRSLVAQLLEPHGTPIVLDANYVGSVFLKGYIGLALGGGCTIVGKGCLLKAPHHILPPCRANPAGPWANRPGGPPIIC